MALQSLNIGTIANDGTGDNLRVGGDKINDNFSEIYTTFGDGSTLSSLAITGLNSATANELVTVGATTTELDAESNLTFDGSTLAVTGAVTVSGLTTLSGNLVIPNAGNIGSVGDTDAIAIASGGAVTFSQAPVFPDGSIALVDLDIDGGTDVGEALVDADLLIVDNGAGGTNRKTEVSRIKTYVADVTLTTAAQGNITSLGTLTTLTVDSIIINGTNIGHTSDTDAMAISSGGVVTFSQVPLFPADTIETADIQADAVTGAKIADDAIDSEHYTDGSVDLAHISTAAKTEVIAIACGDETTATAAATAVVTFHMPYAFTLTGVKAGVTTAPVGSVLTVDINEAGTSILSTKLTIDASEKTSATAATAAVISDTGLASDALMTIDVDGVGSSTAGAGLKVYLIGYQT